MCPAAQMRKKAVCIVPGAARMAACMAAEEVCTEAAQERMEMEVAVLHPVVVQDDCCFDIDYPYFLFIPLLNDDIGSLVYHFI